MRGGSSALGYGPGERPDPDGAVDINTKRSCGVRLVGQSNRDSGAARSLVHPVSPFGRCSAVSNRAVRRARPGSAGVARSRVHSRSSRCCPCSAKPPRQPTRLRERGPGQQPLQSASSHYIRSNRNDRARLLQIDNPKWISRGARYRSICLRRFSSRPRDNNAIHG